MADNERPRPHGDPLDRVVEPNRAQRQSDAADDAVASPDAQLDTSDRAQGRGSTANGVPEFDEDAGRKRKKQYDEGAGMVSGID